MGSAVRIADGTFDFSLGIDSERTTTVQTPANPHGLPRQMLAWMTNATVRGGGIRQRTGWKKLFTAHAGNALFQGAFLYEPPNANPYYIAQIGGRIFKITVEEPFTVTDLSTTFGLFNPATVQQAFFCQGEQFLVIQAGDARTNPTPTLPLFWDGSILRRSNGLTGNVSGPNINELPAAECMCYYQGRIWYAQGRIYSAGDIVGGPSGTVFYKLKDSILKVTENPLALGGDGFTVPDNAGEIRALAYTANQDSTLGQGPLYIFTRRQIYSLVVPVTRNDWKASDSNNTPVQTIVQRKYGAVGDRCVVPVNGDLFYQSLEPGIRSLFVSVRYFQQWGNVKISSNEERVLGFNNRALMRTATGIEFDNRLLQAVLPIQTPVGVAFQAIVPLDFELISTLQEQLPPAWEGILEGIDILQLHEGDFGGLQRAFSFVHSRETGDIDVWELTNADKFDRPHDVDNRVPWYFETPAFNANKDFEMKVLDGGEIWMDRLVGTVRLTVEYRVDADACWRPWFDTQFCSAKNSCEDVNNPICYPVEPFCEGQKWPITLPSPPNDECANLNSRPTTIGYQFQLRVTIKGWCRVRGLLVYMTPRDRAPFENLTC